jgi:hypothetical protein
MLIVVFGLMTPYSLLVTSVVEKCIFIFKIEHTWLKMGVTHYSETASYQQDYMVLQSRTVWSIWQPMDHILPMTTNNGACEIIFNAFLVTAVPFIFLPLKDLKRKLWLLSHLLLYEQVPHMLLTLKLCRKM